MKLKIAEQETNEETLEFLLEMEAGRVILRGRKENGIQFGLLVINPDGATTLPYKGFELLGLQKPTD